MNIKEKSKPDLGVLTKFLFVIYLIVLTWAILFKFKLNIHELNGRRNLLIKTFFLNRSRFYKADFCSNLFAFVPFGIYISALKRKGKVVINLIVSVLVMFATSLFYETAQYIFKIGCSDINDLISNTLGGIIGVIIYYILYLIFRKRTNTVVTVLAFLGTIAVTVFVVISILNGSCSTFQNQLLKLFNS